MAVEEAPLLYLDENPVELGLYCPRSDRYRIVGRGACDTTFDELPRVGKQVRGALNRVVVVGDAAPVEYDVAAHG